MEKIVKICKGYIIASLLFSLMSFTSAAILRSTDINAGYSAFIITVPLGISMMVCAAFIGNAFKKCGIITGLISGLMNTALFVFLFTTALNAPFISSLLNTAYIIPLVLSVTGGIIGTNAGK